MLLTRPPLTERRASSPFGPLDLHVLGTPPAFVLSQDQTLQKKVRSLKMNKQGLTSSCSVFKVRYDLERVMGIEPTTTAWKAVVLPLNYTRKEYLKMKTISFLSGKQDLNLRPPRP